MLNIKDRKQEKILKISDYNGRDDIERIYLSVGEALSKCLCSLIPYVRRCIRFMALPYCYIMLVNWKECKKSKFQVCKDFLYIFFVLKYFPDNYSECRLWEIPRANWKFYYGSTYDPYQRRALRKFVQPKKYEILYEDKEVFNKLCLAEKFDCPKTIKLVNAGDDIKRVLGELHDMKFQGQTFLMKPIDGKGGHQIIVIEYDGANFSIKNASTGIPLTKFIIDKDYLIQEYITQIDALNQVSKSVNTIRIATMLGPSNEFLILGAYMRFGVGRSLIDNYSKGGIKVKIDLNTGKLSGYGCNNKNIRFPRHPDSGVEFNDLLIPKWEQVVHLAKRIQCSLSFHRLLGMDIAITESGPVIIEANSIYDNVGLENISGPILKNENVLKAFYHFNLLINDKQKKLAMKIAN